MELDITNFFQNACMRDYSASAHELGDCAGAITWNAALKDCRDYLPAFSLDDQARVREWLAGFGAWTRAELAEMNWHEIMALLLQFIAGDIRESGVDTASPDWSAYEQGANAGRYSGRFYRGDDSRVYYYVGD